MDAINVILNYASLKRSLKECIKIEDYNSAKDICELLCNSKNEINNMDIDELKRQCQKVINIINDIINDREDTNDIINNIVNTKENNNTIYYHLIINDKTHSIIATEGFCTPFGWVYSSSDEKDFINNAIQILINRKIIDNTANEVNTITKDIKDFIDRIKQSNNKDDIAEAKVPDAGSDYDIDKEADNVYYIYGIYGKYNIGYGKAPINCIRLAKDINVFAEITSNYIIDIADLKDANKKIDETWLRSDIRYIAKCIDKGVFVDINELNYPNIFGYKDIKENCED